MSDLTPVYTFANVRQACLRYQMNARLYLFDAGETIEISSAIDGRQMARITSLWGDPSAADQAAKWLMDNSIATVFDFVE